MTVYLIAGHAGTGKSTLGRTLAAHLRCPVLDMDTLCRPLTEVCNLVLDGDPGDRSSSTYLRYVRPREYAALHDTIVDVAGTVDDVVAVADWLGYVDDIAWSTKMSTRARHAGHDTIVTWTTCTDVAFNGRLTRRNNIADWSELDTWIDVVDGRATAPPRCADIVIDTTDGISTHTIADMVAAARRRSTHTGHAAYMK